MRRGATQGRINNLQFSVRDTGIGISQEKRRTIFREFEQADSSTTRRYGGTGLGLAISSRLVELMGGRIWVESVPRRGSTFHFTTRMEVGSEQGLAKTLPVSLGGSPVLIVDDNQTNRLILEEMVTNWGMVPVQAASVQEAQELLEAATAERRFRLVLSDVNMPDVDGFQFAEWIRARMELSQLPVILLTSGARMGDQHRREQLGIAASLMKPIKQSELYNTIVRVLGVTPTQQPSEKPAAAEQERPLRVLLAEDSLFNQRLAVTLLEKRGHQVTLAQTGRAAVEAFERETFDVILMDVQMPELDGLEATEQIRRREQDDGLPRTPIIAMTAHALKGDREHCLDIGMDEYVSKPIDPEQLFATMGRIVPPLEEGIVLDFEEEPESPGLEDATDDQNAPAESLADASPSADDSGERSTLDSEVGESGTLDYGDVVDFEAAKTRVGGRMETVKTLALILRQECPKLLQQLAAAMQAEDAKEMRRAAHTIKGSSGHFLAQRVVAAAKKLEEMGERAEFTDAAAAFTDLEQEVACLCDAIDSTFGSRSP